jgi:hypothetical protein
MKTKTINLYKFEELTTEQQEKVLDKYRDWNDDLTCNLIDYDYIHIEKLKEKGFLNPDISYDLSYSQGDGASFTCTELDYNLLLKDYKGKHKKWFIQILEYYVEVQIERTSHHYYHELTCKTEYYDRLPLGCPRIQTELETIVDYIENLREQACLELKHDLQADIDYLQSDECIAESFIDNDYYFNGETLEIEY